MSVAAVQSDELIAPFIEGSLTDSGASEFVDVVNPSNGKRLARLPVGSEGDVSKAVGSSRRAFDDGRWSDAPPSLRKKVLQEFGALIEAESADLDRLDASEMGKPVSLGLFNAAGAAGVVRFCAEAIDKITGDVYGSDKTTFVSQVRRPRGVIGAIVPWNFPTYNAALKLAPALAAGNTVVLKPSEMSSRSAIRLAQLAIQAGLPPGVLNVVPGLGQTTGRSLGLHMGVDMVSFTGSTAVGKRLLEYSGQSNMKNVMAECGGKSPQIVFDDGVDLDAAATAIGQMLLMNQGQVCSLGSRLLVQRSIARAMTEKVQAQIARPVIGDALDADTTFGPLVSDRQRDRVIDYISSAQADGAKLVTGGNRVMLDTGGFFVEPTIFGDVPADARIAQEEIFGPVLSIIPFDDEADAIRIANGTIYGLAAYVWTSSLSTGMRVAKGVRSAVVVNAVAPTGEGAGHVISLEPHGQSGLGVEGGLAGLESYLTRQLIWFNHG